MINKVGHMLRFTFTLLAAAALAACAEPIDTITKRPALTPKAISMQPSVITPGPAQAETDRFAKAFLDSIQARSISERRELCGFFIRNDAGQLQATPPRAGTFAGCNMPVPNRRDNIVASYHTHGAYGSQYDNEVPSTTDLQSDFILGIDGYLSTPGGRVWHVSNVTREASQICGLGCVTRDPGFIPRNETQVAQRYSIATLIQRHGA
jgi:hypothetical protein